MAGTDNMETMMRMSALQPMSQDTISILESAGSRGNSTISRPVGVRAPEGTQANTVTRSRVKKLKERRGMSDALLLHHKLV